MESVVHFPVALFILFLFISKIYIAVRNRLKNSTGLLLILPVSVGSGPSPVCMAVYLLNVFLDVGLPLLYVLKSVGSHGC